MASRPRRSNYVKKLAKEIPDEKKMRALLATLGADGSQLADYAVALIGSTLIEGALETAIIARFRPLDQDERRALFSFEKNGPLADLAARIKIAYALEIFGPETRDDLESIRRIRNEFAHHLAVLSFATPEIAAQCKEPHVVDTLEFSRLDPRGPRNRYIYCAATIARKLRRDLSFGLAWISQTRGVHRG